MLWLDKAGWNLSPPMKFSVGIPGVKTYRHNEIVPSASYLSMRDETFNGQRVSDLGPQR